MLAGGIVFILSLLAVAGARSFLVLLAAVTVFFPASGAFVSLTQADLLVDVLTGFLAVYLVDVVRLPPAVAALAIALRLGAGLAGDAALVFVLERVADVTVLRVTAAAAAVLYPGFLLAPGPVTKLVILAVLSGATAPWYPLLQARLYGSLPGRSSVAVTLSSAAGLAGWDRWPWGCWPGRSGCPGRWRSWPSCRPRC